MPRHQYYYTKREANFGKPLRTERRGGAHLTCEIVLHTEDTLHALLLLDGMHDGPKNALYFPHGLIRFGESVMDCAGRLASDQANVQITRAALFTLPSWVDDDEHWHLCLNILAAVARPPRAAGSVAEVVPITMSNIPDNFGWWTVDQVRSLLQYLRVVDGHQPY